MLLSRKKHKLFDEESSPENSILSIRFVVGGMALVCIPKRGSRRKFELSLVEIKASTLCSNHIRSLQLCTLHSFDILNYLKEVA